MLGLFCMGLIASPLFGADRLPNVVLIMTDDQGYGDVGCYGASDFRTPHMDSLAKNGTRFTSFYVSQPVCTASRASLLTGCYANRVGFAGALNPTSLNGIHEREVLISELLKERGYATAIFGKWHLGYPSRFNPLNHGFDEYFGLPFSNDNSNEFHPIIRTFPPLPYSMVTRLWPATRINHSLRVNSPNEPSSSSMQTKTRRSSSMFRTLCHTFRFSPPKISRGKVVAVYTVT